MNKCLRNKLGQFSSKQLRLPNDARLEPVVIPTETPQVSFGKNYRTCQIYSSGFEFAFASEIGKVWQQACTFVYCKDFLHDAVWAHLNKKPWEIYGFKYTPGVDPDLDMKHCAMFFRNTQYKGKQEEFHAMRPNCQEFLNKCEDAMGMKHSTIYEVPNDDAPCWLIVSDKGWQVAAPMLGLYTLMVRVGLAHTLGNTHEQTLQLGREGQIKFDTGSTSYAGNRDGGYIKTAWKGVSTILKHGLNVWHPTIEENYPADLITTIGSLHDNGGPVSYSRGYAKKAMPFWYRDEVWND